MSSQRFYELVNGLDAIVGKQSTRLTRYSVFHASWRERRHRVDTPHREEYDSVDFIGCLYVFLPGETERQETVKQRIPAYVALEAKAGRDVMFIVASGKCCGSQGCSGHYEEPLSSELETDLLLHDRFPEDISGTYVYFIEREKFKGFFEKDWQ
ncbi:MAG: hypothetical protein KJ955_00865 [Nanoarchaeota archaeon]|nr:hypothetical protein [Nanoarchaeota archaeon]